MWWPPRARWSVYRSCANVPVQLAANVSPVEAFFAVCGDVICPVLGPLLGKPLLAICRVIVGGPNVTNSVSHAAASVVIGHNHGSNIGSRRMSTVFRRCQNPKWWTSPSASIHFFRWRCCVCSFTRGRLATVFRRCHNPNWWTFPSTSIHFFRWRYCFRQRYFWRSVFQIAWWLNVFPVLSCERYQQAQQKEPLLSHPAPGRP